MKELFDDIPTEDLDGERVYAVEAIRAAAHEVINLAGDGLLAVRDDDGHVSFVVVRFFRGPATQGGVVVDGSKYEHVFHGDGYSPGLRELRHTFWGEADNAKLITDALQVLRRWFDVD